MAESTTTFDFEAFMDECELLPLMPADKIKNITFIETTIAKLERASQRFKQPYQSNLIERRLVELKRLLFDIRNSRE